MNDRCSSCLIGGVRRSGAARRRSSVATVGPARAAARPATCSAPRPRSGVVHRRVGGAWSMERPGARLVPSARSGVLRAWISRRVEGERLYREQAARLHDEVLAVAAARSGGRGRIGEGGRMAGGRRLERGRGRTAKCAPVRGRWTGRRSESGCRRLLRARRGSRRIALGWWRFVAA